MVSGMAILPVCGLWCGGGGEVFGLARLCVTGFLGVAWRAAGELDSGRLILPVCEAREAAGAQAADGPASGVESVVA